ncbi:MAG: hypothetical protein SXG53_24915 [Pseudomonadota bacterium]|nr:hypothetical protein [Pseudomonadota bacterium]
MLANLTAAALIALPMKLAGPDRMALSAFVTLIVLAIVFVLATS